MGYRIRMALEVAGWLGQLRDADPGTAALVDEALAALCDQGASLGPPLVIPAEVGIRLPVVGAQLADLRSQYASVRSEEERLTVATRRLQHKVDDFRARKDAAKAAEAAAEAAARAAEAQAAIEGVIAHAEDPDHDATPGNGLPAPSTRLSLGELRPAASVRILFTVESSSSDTEPSGTAILLAAGTERDWLDA